MSPAGAPVTAPVAPAGSTPPRAKAGKTPFCPPDLPEPWYAGLWLADAGDWLGEIEWFETWEQAHARALELAPIPYTLEPTG